MPTRQCVSVDFDGLLHSYHDGWKDGSIYGELDFDLISRLHSLGYAVAVSTCRPVQPVALVMRNQGFRVKADLDMRASFWIGGTEGNTVLITNRKIAAVAYLDDRAVPLRFGQDDDAVSAALAEVARLASRRDGIRNQ